LVHRPSAAADTPTFGADQRQASDRERLWSTESSECPADSIFDYHSTHPSVDLDDTCCPDDIVTVNVNTGVGGSVLVECRKDVISSHVAEVTDSTAVTTSIDNHESAATSKSKLPLSSSSQLSLVPSSRIQSRLLAPRSRSTVKTGASNHQTSKPGQLSNGLPAAPCCARF